MPDFIVASATASQEEIDHAVSPNWRDPIPAKEDSPSLDGKTEEVTPETSQEEVKTAPDSEPEVTQEEEKPKGKGGFQRKIDKLTGEKKEALSRAERLESELAEFKDRFKAIEERLAGKPAETVEEKPKAPETPGKPLESEIGTKYKDWNEFNEALIEWKADRRLEARLAERDEQSRTSQEREIQEAREANYRESAKEFLEKTPDFNDAINAAARAGMKLPLPILERIQELPNGPQVTYYLVTNPDEALALVEADPVEGFMQLGRISYGLELETKQPPKPPAKKDVSAAPAPVKPVTGHSARSGNTLQEISARSSDEYIRRRRAEMAERERAGRR